MLRTTCSDDIDLEITESSCLSIIKRFSNFRSINYIDKKDSDMLVSEPHKGCVMRILCIDYGSRRLGLAVCDELGLTAQGLATITRKNRERDLEEINRVIQQYAVETIVVGFPVRLNGTEGIQCEKVNRFVDILKSRFSLPIVKWDETLSTKEAEQVLIEANMSRKKRKGVVDKIAAAIILQDYLDYINRTKA
jgi:putative Holliday junction resolvase